MILKENIHINCAFKDQDEAINGLIDHLSLSDDIKQCVKDREISRSTSVPEGIAFPHCHAKTEKLLITLAVLKNPIPWGNNMVNIVVLLCSAQDFACYVKTLAIMCKIFNSEIIRQQISLATSNEEVYHIITSHPAYHIIP